MLYTQSHEWIRRDGAIVTIGITDYGQDSLGEIAFVELPSVGQSISAGDTLCVVESVKAASEIRSPVSGVIQRVNAGLLDAPRLINQSPEEEGWLCALRLKDDDAIDDKFLKLDQYNSLVNLP